MAKVLQPNILNINIPFNDDVVTCCTDGVYIYINTSNYIYKYDIVNNIISVLASKPSNVYKYKNSECVYHNGYIYYMLSNHSSEKLYFYYYKCNIENGVISLIGSHNKNQVYDIYTMGNYVFKIENNIYYYNIYFDSSSYKNYILNIYSNDNSIDVKSGFATNKPFGYNNVGDNSSINVNDGFLQSLIINNKWYSNKYTLHSSSTYYKFISTEINGTTLLTPTIYTEDTSNINKCGLCYNIDNENSFLCIKGNDIYEYNILNNVLNVKIDNLPISIESTQAINVGDNIYLINKDYIIKIGYVEYNNTYTLSNNNGDIIYKELTNNSPITSIRFNYNGGDVGYVLLTLTDLVSGSYTPQIPQGYKLIGYSLSPNSNKAIFELNKTIPYNITESTTLYEVYGKYRPLTTSFTMTLYKNSAEFNRVDKTDYLEIVGDISGMLREETDIINPSINIETPFIDFNYVYIETFNRYYYVKNITSIRNNIWRVGLAVDVLMSYKDLIKQQKALIGRQENYYNKYLVDTEIICESNKDYTFVEIPNDILNTEESQQPCFIATILGALPIATPTNEESE